MLSCNPTLAAVATSAAGVPPAAGATSGHWACGCSCSSASRHSPARPPQRAWAWTTAITLADSDESGRKLHRSRSAKEKASHYHHRQNDDLRGKRDPQRTTQRLPNPGTAQLATATPIGNAPTGIRCCAACAQCRNVACTPNSTTLPVWVLANTPCPTKEYAPRKPPTTAGRTPMPSVSVRFRTQVTVESVPNAGHGGVGSDAGSASSDRSMVSGGASSLWCTCTRVAPWLVEQVNRSTRGCARKIR